MSLGRERLGNLGRFYEKLQGAEILVGVLASLILAALF